MNRIILHIDMDAFFPAVEQRENPQFQGLPVVVGADPKHGKGRGVVSSASYEARKYGIHSALPISKAYLLCPKAVFLPPNMQLYKRVSGKVMEIVKKYSPTYEITSLDEAYLDISFEENYKKARHLAQRLKKEIFEKEKLTSTIGIGPNKLVAKMAAQEAKLSSELRSTPGVKPNGLLVIEPQQVSEFLEPLDIEKLPGIGQKTGQKLRTLGVNKIKELKNLPKEGLKEMFGKWGEGIYERARGIDEKPVSAEESVKSIGKEHTFEEDTRNPDIIFGVFDKIIEEVWKELIENGFGIKTVTVVCRFSGFETHTKSKTLKEPIDGLETLTREAKKLLLRFLLENKKPVRLIGTRLKIH